MNSPREIHTRRSHAHLQEIAVLVCEYFCQGMPPTEISRVLKDRHNIRISREEPYRYLAYATTRNWMRFDAPKHFLRNREMLETFPFLRGVDILESPIAEGVTDRAAEIVCSLIWSRAEKQSEVRVGFAGGRTIAQIARRMALILNSNEHKMPKRLFCHSLVSGFDTDDLETNPVAFLAPIVSRPPYLNRSDWHRHYVGIQSPALVEMEEREALLKRSWNRDAVDTVKDIDIVVTSAASISDRHSSLRRYGDDPKTMAQILKQHYGCVGDMLWMPIRHVEDNLYRPLQFSELKKQHRDKVRFRAMTLLELPEIARLIRGNKHKRTDVVMSLGACPLCGQLKDDILKAVLYQNEPLITHLIVDVQTASRMMETCAS